MVNAGHTVNDYFEPARSEMDPFNVLPVIFQQHLASSLPFSLFILSIHYYLYGGYSSCFSRVFPASCFLLLFFASSCISLSDSLFISFAVFNKNKDSLSLALQFVSLWTLFEIL